MRCSRSRGVGPALTAVAGLLLLAGCTAVSDAVLGKTEQFACPRYGGLETATTQTKFRSGPGRDLTDVMYIVRLADVQRACRYDRSGAEVLTRVGFALELGPANPDRTARFEYFVAIADANDAVLARETFPVTVTFPANVGYVEHSEDIEQRIPLPRGVSAADHQIIVGLQLSRDELEYNRRTQRR